MSNEAQFPPKCCLTEIPLNTIMNNIQRDQREQYRLKAAEFSLPAGERWYCPSPSCLRWIDRSHWSGFLTTSLQRLCPHCHTGICIVCRGAAHPTGQECPQDFALEATLDFAEQEGWRRCIRCKAMVELTVGCRHITCKCKAEFCYTCGAVWRTCNCTEDDEAERKRRVRNAKKEREKTVAREEQEILDAIAAVEEMERREVEEAARVEAWRIQREEEVARERAAAEERQRIEEQERLENHQRDVEASVDARHAALTAILSQINSYQQSNLTNRHFTDTDGLRSVAAQIQEKYTSDASRLSAMLESNIKQRQIRLANIHASNTSKLVQQHDDQQDETFLSLQLHLRGKPDRETRTEAIMNKLRAAQAAEQVELDLQHEGEKKQSNARCKVEEKALIYNLAMRRTVEDRARNASTKSHAEHLLAERQWTEHVFQRRYAMLEQWRATAIEQGDVVEAWPAICIGMTYIDASGSKGKERASADAAESVLAHELEAHHIPQPLRLVRILG